MRRREFVAIIGGGAVWPLATRAQELRAVGKIGFLFPGPEALAKSRSVPFLAGLASEGLHEPDQITLLIRATGGDVAQIAPLLNDLLARKIDLIVPGAPVVTRAVRAAVANLPIVMFDLETDPMESGWIQSYARPGGNLTGMFGDFPSFSTKWLELLKETVQGLARVVTLWDPTTTTVQTKAVAAAAQLFNVKTEVVEFKSPSELGAVFDAVSARRPDGLLLLSSPIISIYSSQLAEMALKHRLPAISMFSSFARAGGLMAYGPNIVELYRETGVMAAKVLKGTKPGDLPAERPSRFEFVINLKTAKALDIEFPPRLLALADEVIE